jgi:hypothetical protein
MAHDVFISYASSDKAVADAVCSQLESLHRIRCWIAPRDVTPGASWAESIIDALDGSKIMVLIFSSNANASMQIEREVERAVHKGINIIPLRIENTLPTKTLEYFISAPHWLDALSVPLEHHIEKLAVSVNALLARQTPVRPAEGTIAPAPAVAPITAAAPARPSGPVPAAPVPPATSGPAAASRPATTPRPTTAPPPSAAQMPVRAPVVAPAMSATPAATTEPARRPWWLLPAAGLLLVGVGLFAMSRLATSPAGDSAANTATSAPVAPTTSAVPPSAAATTPAPDPSGTPGASAAPAVPPATATAPPATASAAATSDRSAAPSPARATKSPNVAIELDSNLPKGSVRVVVDGGHAWTTTLDGSAKTGALSLAKGAHQVIVTLLNPAGEAKETKTTRLDADPEIGHTLKIRLSRFRRNLEIEASVNKPAARTTPPAASTKDGAPAKPPATKP